jgi:GNAT superfamily N-acetyltransferase
MQEEKWSIFPVDAARWPDLERLFGPHGAGSGCWCMYWRLPRKEFNAGCEGSNRQALHELIDSGQPVGLLAYLDGNPVGWCAVAPRAAYPVMQRSKILRSVDEQPVWSVSCFFVARKIRRKGLTVALLEAAADYAREHGASLLEGYPTDPQGGKAADPFVYTGLMSAFLHAGFHEVARRSEKRPIMRRELNPA